MVSGAEIDHQFAVQSKDNNQSFISENKKAVYQQISVEFQDIDGSVQEIASKKESR